MYVSTYMWMFLHLQLQSSSRIDLRMDGCVNVFVYIQLRRSSCVHVYVYAYADISVYAYSCEAARVQIIPMRRVHIYYCSTRCSAAHAYVSSLAIDVQLTRSCISYDGLCVECFTMHIQSFAHSRMYILVAPTDVLNGNVAPLFFGSDLHFVFIFRPLFCKICTAIM